MKLTKKEDVLGFGKYKGRTVAEVLKKSPEYLEWVVEATERAEFPDDLLAEIKAAANERRDAYDQIRPDMSWGDYQF